MKQIKPPIWLAREAYLPNDEIDRAFALSNPDEFWAERAKGIDWIEP